MELTKSENEVLTLLVQDKTQKEIANMRGRSVYTVNSQIKSARQKFQTNTDHGLAAKFIKMTFNLL